MSGARFSPGAGPQRRLEALAQQLFSIGGQLAKYRAAGGHISAQEVRLLVEFLDLAAKEAERVMREVQDIADLVEDSVGAADPQAVPELVVRLEPPLTVITGGLA